MKKIIILLLTVSLFNYSAFSQEISKTKTLMLQSTGKIEIAPDMASLTINLECLNKEILESKSCLIQKSNELHKKLKKMGVDKDDLMTTGVTLNKSYRYENGNRKFEGYKSSTSVIVTVRDLGILDDVYSDLLENENLTVSGLSFSHSQMNALKNKAYVKALRNAKNLADALLEELPETEKEILKIGNTSFNSSVPRSIQNNAEMMMVADAGLGRKQTVAIGLGLIKINASLQVEFILK